MPAELVSFLMHGSDNDDNDNIYSAHGVRRYRKADGSYQEVCTAVHIPRFHS